MFDKLHEECGIFGIYNNDNINTASSVYYGLFALQHRGQESCGIAINDDGIISCVKDVGLVNDVFDKEKLETMGNGKMAIGHVRYGTTGVSQRLNAQPIVVNHIKGCMALAHNGNLTNAYEIRQQLEMNGSIFHTTSDTEVIAYEITKMRLTSKSIEEAVCKAMDSIKGAYSLLVMSPSKLIAARDPNGFRPLCLGKIDNSYMFASESCAFAASGGEFIRDLLPGEVVVIDKDGIRSITDNCKKAKPSLCVFEFIYFARPDSVIDGASVHQARLNAGAFLALEHPVQADVVVGVPDSGIDAAVGYSHQSGIPYGIGLIKNKYIGRTFIEPGQAMREDKVRIKLNVIEKTVKDKRVVLIDDSIVRGTTCARIVKLLREAGAKEVHMRVSAPPFKNPCYFGTDIDSRENLIANQHTVKEIAEIIGVDTLGYLSVDSAKKIAKTTTCGFCTACFDGDYPVSVPDKPLKSKFMFKIGESTDEKLQ